MTSAVYPNAKELFLGADLSLTTMTIKAALIDTGVYTYSATHAYWSAASAALIGSAVTLATGKTITSGVFDADDVTISTVTGNSAEAIILYQDTGSSSTSPLICFIDSGTGLPVTPNGGDISLVWDNGANKIFAL